MTHMQSPQTPSGGLTQPHFPTGALCSVSLGRADSPFLLWDFHFGGFFLLFFFCLSSFSANQEHTQRPNPSPPSATTRSVEPGFLQEGATCGSPSESQPFSAQSRARGSAQRTAAQWLSNTLGHWKGPGRIFCPAGHPTPGICMVSSQNRREKELFSSGSLHQSPVLPLQWHSTGGVGGGRGWHSRDRSPISHTQPTPAGGVPLGLHLLLLWQCCCFKPTAGSSWDCHEPSAAFYVFSSCCLAAAHGETMAGWGGGGKIFPSLGSGVSPSCGCGC